MPHRYSFDVLMKCSYDEALDTVATALQQEGFGILTKIDAHKAFKDKLGETFRPYSILGACNPRLAFRALSQRPEAGLMLPCNVVVESNPGGGSIIRILNPVAAIQGSALGEDEEIRQVAAEAGAALERVAASLR